MGLLLYGWNDLGDVDSDRINPRNGLIATLRAAGGGKPIVVYPNSGAQYDAERKCWHGQESAGQWAEQAVEWYRAGASLIGGCCRIGPDHIRQLAKSETWHC